MSLCSPPPLIETYREGAVCVSIICLLVQFSFKSAAETSECKAQVDREQSVATSSVIRREEWS